MDWYLKVLKQYTRFNGRARRKEYWMFALFNFLIAILLGIVDAMIFGEFPLLGLIYNFGILLPSLAVSIRRLHDTERSGWWILINIIPLIGFLVFLFFMIQDSQPGRNKYGRNPKESQE